ncbi:unnamed protein product [Penicillium pancosmium]
MPRLKVKTKADDLTRVRNNQRNCRARQKEYIRVLEEKVRYYETSQKPRFDDMQKKIDLLSVETQLLKYFVESSTSLVNWASGPPLPPSHEACGAGIGLYNTGSLLSSGDSTTLNFMPSATTELRASTSIMRDNDYLSEGDFSLSETCLPEGPLSDEVFPYMSQSSMNMTEDLELLHYPPAETEPYSDLGPHFELSALESPTMNCNPCHSDLFFQPTISCAEACELLISYVRKKPDLMSLHLKLRHGYRDSLVQGEGCRVDYHLLLAVLSERQ